MTDRRNFFEKLGRSLQLEDEQYPEANLTEQDFLKAQETTPETPEVFQPEEPEFTPEEVPAEEPVVPAEEPEEVPPAQEEVMSASLASATLARKRVASKTPARRVAPRTAKKPATANKNGVEGRLTIDVYETETEIVVKSTVAGVDSSELDINITPDSISIRGSRTQEEKVSSDSYFYQECFWGAFSRSVILPTEIDPDRAKASLKKGVLTIRLPKLSRSEERKLVIDSD